MSGKIKKILNKIYIEFKKYVKNNYLFLIYLCISVIISLMLRFLTVGISFSLKTIFSDLIFTTLIGSFGYIFKTYKGKYKYYLTLLWIYAIFAAGNSIYYIFYKSFLSISLIDSLSQVGEVESAVFDKLRVVDFLFLLFPIAFTFIYKKTVNKFITSLEKRSMKLFRNTLIVSVASLIILISTLTGTEISRIVKQWNREYIVQRFGIYAYHINDAVQSLQPKINTLFGYDSAAREFREFYKEEIANKKDEDNSYTNIYEGKNLILVHMESIQGFLINLKINGQEVTPNLNKLIKESIYFDSFYPQVSTGTSSDTEFTCETGLLPSNTGIVFVSYFDRKYEAMPKKLKEKGYYTFSMHANNGDYWNRNVMHKNLGYQKFYSENSYVVTEEETIGLGLSDKSFFKQIVPIIKNIKETNSPFFGTIITLTNHTPWPDTDKYGDFDVTMPYTYVDENGVLQQGVSNYLEGEEMGNYIKAVHYADEALGELIEMLDEEGILDNTIIALYGDHESKIGKSQFNLLYNYDPVTGEVKSEDSQGYVSLDNYKYDLLKNTPFIIWDPSGKTKAKTVSTVMGMYDVMPTLANMFNFDYTYAMGHDVFSNSEKIVIFANGNFLTNKVYYNSLKGDYVTLTDEPISEDYIEYYKEYAEKRLSVSQNLIIYDLINKEEKKLMEELNNE